MALGKPKVETGQMYRIQGSSDTYRIKFIDLDDRKVQLARVSYSMPKVWLNNLTTSLLMEHGPLGDRLGQTIAELCRETLSNNWDVKEEGSFTISWDNFVESGFYQVYSIEHPFPVAGIAKAQS